jgi:ribosomal-protein-alanine N-acetyltransferase
VVRTLSCPVRRADVSDAPSIYAIERVCFHDPYTEEFLNDLIKSRQEQFFVATNDGEIIGYAVGSASGKEGHIVSVAVDPRHRRKQVGTALLCALRAKLTAEGIKEIQLEVRKGNVGAIAFYERMGYRIISEIRHYYGDGEDAWVLRQLTESSVFLDQ